MENKFNDKKFISIDDLTVENIQQLYDCEYDLEIANLIVCADCGYVMQEDDVIQDTRMVDGYEDYWDYSRETPEQRDVEYEEEYSACPICDYGSDEGQEFDSYQLTISDLFDKDLNGLSDYTGNEFVEALEDFKSKLNENRKIFKKGEIKVEGKQNLQEATIKALYDGLKDDEEVKDVEGLVDDILVVTDPEITTEEYNELIDRAQEIVEETPEGDIPLDPTYLGEYLQICPICGGSFIEDHILEPGTACPICYETPESFVMVGKLQAEEDVAEDSGLVDDENAETEPVLNINDGETSEEDTIEEPITEPEKPELVGMETEPSEETPNRIRGARMRRNREVASKELPEGNLLVESKDPEEGFDINLDLAHKVDNNVKVGSVVASYHEDTNTIVFYDEASGEDLDTIVYRNQTPEEIKKYMLSDMGLALKESYKSYVIETISKGNNEQYMKFQEWKELNENSSDEKARYKVSFYVDSSETPKSEIEAKLNDALKGTGLASGKEDIEIEVDEVFEEAKQEDDKELLLGSEEDEITDTENEKEQQEISDEIQKDIDEKDYTLKMIFGDEIKELANKSAFTWEGVDLSEENLLEIVKLLKEHTKIKLPVNFFVFDGRTMNKTFGLTEKNAYQDDLHFLSIDLDNWSEMGNLPIFKMQVGARWLDDIVDNNQRRQDEIDGIDVDAEDYE